MAATGTAQRDWLVDYVAAGAFYADDYPRTCAQCGQGIANVVTARHRSTGETVFLGLDCAERIGLTGAQLKAHYAEKFAAERAERQAAARRVKRQAEADARVAARLAAEAAAPPQPFRNNPAADPDALYYDEALFDLTGELVCAKPVFGQYGRTWMLTDRWGGNTTGWFSPSRAQDDERARKANARKGYYVGWAGWVAAGGRNRRWANRDLAPVSLEDNGQLELPEED
jgi:hypothetical protein